MTRSDHPTNYSYLRDIHTLLVESSLRYFRRDGEADSATGTDGELSNSLLERTHGDDDSNDSDII